MREIVIVISDLHFPPHEADPAHDSSSPGEAGRASAEGTPCTLPGFEHAARFGHRSAIEGGWRPWLARRLGRDDLAGVAPAVIAAAAVDTPTPADTPAIKLPPAATVWLATPLHLIAGLTSLHVDRRSLLCLPTSDLESFAKDFNQTFVDADLSLTPLVSGDFLLQGPGTLIGSTTEPARALVTDLQASLPKGNDAKPLKRLGAELEMWFHAHPLNETRRRAGQLPVSTLWLWGGGPRDTLSAHPTSPAGMSSNTRANVAFGTDPYLQGLCRLSGAQTHPLPEQLNTRQHQPDPQRAVLVTEVTPFLQKNPHANIFDALTEIDRRFLTPALVTLRQGDVESVILLANDTEVRLRRHDHLRFWRPRRPALGALRP